MYETVRIIKKKKIKNFTNLALDNECPTSTTFRRGRPENNNKVHVIVLIIFFLSGALVMGACTIQTSNSLLGEAL